MRVLTFVHRFLPKIRPCNITVLLAYWAKEFANLPTDILKMLALALDGITSLSNKPIRLITGAGIVVSLISFIGVIWAIVQAVLGSAVAGWASTICIVCFMGGVQLVCLGVIGEYVGKIYMETKARPRYIISERTWAPYERKYHG